jgi:hypothetical protein
MTASNIHSVDLDAKSGKVTISGAFTDMNNRCVTLLHIWLAQPGADGQGAVGLAIDALAETASDDVVTKFNPDEEPSFELTALGTALDVNANTAQFRPGPATVSAIAVIAPKDPSGPPTEVLQWSRTLTLSAGDEGKHVGLKTLFGDG